MYMVGDRGTGNAVGSIHAHAHAHVHVVACKDARMYMYMSLPTT